MPITDNSENNGTPIDATELAGRILRGENVPLETLVQFITQADQKLTKERKAREQPKEVDFF